MRPFCTLVLPWPATFPSPQSTARAAPWWPVKRSTAPRPFLQRNWPEYEFQATPDAAVPRRDFDAKTGAGAGGGSRLPQAIYEGRRSRADVSSLSRATGSLDLRGGIDPSERT